MVGDRVRERPTRRRLKVVLCSLATLLALPMMLFLFFVAFAPDGGAQPGAALRVAVLAWLVVLALLLGAAWLALFRRGSTWLHRRTSWIALAALALSALSWAVLVTLIAVGD